MSKYEMLSSVNCRKAYIGKEGKILERGWGYFNFRRGDPFLHKTKHDKFFANIDLFIFSSLKCCNFTLTPMPNFVDNGYGFTEGRDFRELAFSKLSITRSFIH